MAKGFSDVGLEKFVLHGKRLDAVVQEAVVSAELERSITGPSLLTMSLHDPNRELITSSLFNEAVRASIDELLFEFASYRKSGDQLEVTFESAGWAALKRKKGAKSVKALTSSRTDFAQQLVGEVQWLNFRGEAGDPNKEVLARGKKESSAKALTRLAGDRQWRAFEDEATIFFGGDKWLAGLSEPITISEDDDGIDSIDPEFDGGKRANRATVVCYAKRWASRPGAPIEIKGLGPLASKGLWIVERLGRSLFSQQMTATLIRRVQALPEPSPPSTFHDDATGRAISGDSGVPGPTSAAGWQWPTSGPITGRFGDDRGDHVHSGLDIDGETGDAIYAARPGRVSFAGVAGGYGNMIDIDHGEGYSSRYAHLSAMLVPVGQRVDYDTIIGRMGNTGNSTGSHLHFEIRVGGTARDPLDFLP